MPERDDDYDMIVTGSTKERAPQSKRALLLVSSLYIVDHPQMTELVIMSRCFFVLFADVMLPFSGVTFFYYYSVFFILCLLCFVFFRLFALFIESAALRQINIVLRYECSGPRQRHVVGS